LGGRQIRLTYTLRTVGPSRPLPRRNATRKNTIASLASRQAVRRPVDGEMTTSPDDREAVLSY